MRPSRIVPTGVERTFGTDEIIVSKTDLQGRITYANSVFLRVSGYTEDELIGQPHSIVRHPDLPRTVFALLWDAIKAGEEIFAYINNLAADGSHYWVFAHVTPSYRNGRLLGFHSNRRSPDRSALAAITPVYEAMVAAERRHTKPADAIAASRIVLDDYLAEIGRSYDELVWELSTGATAGAVR